MAGASIALPASAATHTVKKGDTYWLVAKEYGVDFSELLRANNADENSWLTIGQKIVIPEGTRYTVKKGDTYWLIAKKYGVDFTAL